MTHELTEFDEKYISFLSSFYHSQTSRSVFTEIFGEENAKKLGKIAYKIYDDIYNIDEETYKAFSSFIPKINVYYEYKSEQSMQKANSDVSNKSQIDQKIIDLIKDKQLTSEFEEILKELSKKYTFRVRTEINQRYHDSILETNKVSLIAANIISDFHPLWKTGSEFLFRDILGTSEDRPGFDFSEKVRRLSTKDSLKSSKKLDYEYLKLGHALLLLKRFGKEKIKDQLETALLTAIELQKKNAKEKKYPELISAMQDWMLSPKLQQSENFVQLINLYKNDKEFMKLTRPDEPFVYRGMRLDPEVWLKQDEYEIFKRDGTFTLKNIAFEHRKFPGTSWTRNIDVAERLFSKSYGEDVIPCIAKAKTSNNDDSLFDLRRLQRLSSETIELYYETEVFAIGSIVCDITFFAPEETNFSKSEYDDDEDDD